MTIKSSTVLRNDYLQISQLARASGEPIFITNKGEADGVNISSLSDTPDRKKSDTLTAKILHPFRIDGAWRPHGLRTAATPLDHSEIAFSRLMDSPLMVST